MRRPIAVAVLLLLGCPIAVLAQSEREQLIVDAIGSPQAVQIATEHMEVTEEAAKRVSSDVAVPGPGMLDVDPLSTPTEWAVNYETTDPEMCRAAAATAAAAMLSQYSSGERLISTSCRRTMVELTLDLDSGQAEGRQWPAPNADYLWQNKWPL